MAYMYIVCITDMMDFYVHNIVYCINRGKLHVHV